MRTIVVGGASGIGRATRELLLAKGHAVVVLDIADSPDTDVMLDVRNPAAFYDAFGAARKLIGEEQWLVYAPGTHKVGTIASQPVSEWDEAYDVNVRGAFLALQTALGSSTLESVVLISSLAGVSPRGGPGFAAYGSSKAAVAHLARIAAMELAEQPLPIRVNCLAPGWTDTPFNASVWDRIWQEYGESPQDHVERTVPLQRQSTPEEQAEAVVAILGLTYMTGAVVNVDGGLSL